MRRVKGKEYPVVKNAVKNIKRKGKILKVLKKLQGYMDYHQQNSHIQGELEIN